MISAALLAISLAMQAGVHTPPAADSRKQPVKAAALVIDINTASPEEFQRLPGIGPKLARRIVAFREKHGPFRRVEDLLALRGIGHKKWKAIRPYLSVQPAGARK